MVLEIADTGLLLARSGLDFTGELRCWFIFCAQISDLTFVFYSTHMAVHWTADSSRCQPDHGDSLCVMLLLYFIFAVLMVRR